MAEYNFAEIEKKWQAQWAKDKTYRADEETSKPKFYVLDMFPYPSGAGLHVGHPLGYIASDIVARFKRLKGFNVLHPMGYDSFGLPAEQYAIQTGQHPAITTEKNIARYREQLDKIALSFDWDREVRTSDPSYYKWTQWVFIQLFNSWYNKNEDKAEPLSTLIEEFVRSGNSHVNAVADEVEIFSADEWNKFSEVEQQTILLKYRLTYLSDTMVNWCPQLGTVLANEEVKDGVSERGGYAVERKLMRQWSMRISAYADRLLSGLDTIDWSDSIKEAQRNWIGKSKGSSLQFKLKDSNHLIEVFTTRPDTIFGVSFLTLAPENSIVKEITTAKNKPEVEEYITVATNRSERERMADVKKVTGVFTGAYAIHPFSNEPIPVWVGDYVLGGYGTGAVMGVPGHDSRDYAFAKQFGLPIKEVVNGGDLSVAAFEAKEGTLVNSDFLNDLDVSEAIEKAIEKIEEDQIGKAKTNYRLRDAIFSRQRYWGEPIPIYFKDGMPYHLPVDELPLTLPEVDKYLPTESGEPPLARAKNWKTVTGYPLEANTMPGWAGSSWYFFRYMDPHNHDEFVNKEKVNYWQNVDLYMGGQEHATGHLLYARFWVKFLHDMGYLPYDEPAKKLINQGMIQGRSNFVYRLDGYNIFISEPLFKDLDKEKEEVKRNKLIDFIKEYLGEDLTGKLTTVSITPLHVDVNIVSNDVLNIEAFKKWNPEYSHARFILSDGKYICGAEVEKMSKSKWNVVSPDDIISQYGADTLRLYEMFLGPLEQSKPWNTNGITGVSGFLKKLWRLYHSGSDQTFLVSRDEPSKEEFKVLQKTIKKIQEDIERFSFNTSVSTFMICVNELTDLKCHKKEILEPLLIILSPYAPHIAEELWNKIGHVDSVTKAPFPEVNEEYLIENSFSYPVSFNGKVKFNLDIPLGHTQQQIEDIVMANQNTLRLLDGKQIKKIIIVPGRIVNIVI